MVAGGALYPVPNADEVKKANVEGAIDAATVDDTLYAYPHDCRQWVFFVL